METHPSSLIGRHDIVKMQYSPNKSTDSTQSWPKKDIYRERKTETNFVLSWVLQEMLKKVIQNEEKNNIRRKLGSSITITTKNKLEIENWLEIY